MESSIYIPGRDSVVGRATRYDLDGPGVEFPQREVFRDPPDRTWGSPSFLYNGKGFFFLDVKLQDRGVDHSHVSSAAVKARVAI